MSKIVKGFITTTHVDEFGTKLTLDNLKAMMNMLDEMPFVSQEHDPTKPLVCKVIKKEIRELDNGEFGIWARLEVFDEEAIKLLEDGTLKGFSFSGYEKLDESKILNFRLDDRFFNLDDLKSLGSELTTEDEQFISIGNGYHRSIDVIPIIRLIIFVGGLFFVKSLGSRLGEEVGKDAAKAYRGFIDKIKTMLNKKGKQKFFFNIVLKYDDLKITISSQNEISEDLTLKLEKVDNLLKNIDYPVDKENVVEIKLKFAKGELSLFSLVSKDNCFIFEKGTWKRLDSS